MTEVTQGNETLDAALQAPQVSTDALTEQFQKISALKPLPIVTLTRRNFADVSEDVAVAGEPEGLTKIPKNGFDATFAELYFVTEIALELEAPGRALSLTVATPEGELLSVPFEGTERIVTARVQRYASEISISPAGWRPNAKAPERLERLIVRGVSAANLLELEDDARGWCDEIRRFESAGERLIENAKAEVMALNSKKEEHARLDIEANLARTKAESDHRAELEKLKGEIAVLQAEKLKAEQAVAPAKATIDQLQGRLDGMQAQHAKAEREFQAVQEKSEAAARDVAARNEELKALTTKVADATSELRTLKRDVSMYAVEAKGYGWQGVLQVVGYLFIAVVLLAVACLAAWVGYQQTKEIWDAYLKNPALLSVGVLLGLKAGFILVLTSLISGSLTMVWKLITKIMEVFDTKLRFSEISILTKTSVETAMAGKSYSDEESRAVFLATRIQLITMFITERMQQAARGKGQELGPTSGADLASLTKLATKLLAQKAEPTSE